VQKKARAAPDHLGGTTRLRAQDLEAQFSPKVHAPANISMYDGSMNPSVWLEE
jgi:hypothetical protein